MRLAYYFTIAYIVVFLLSLVSCQENKKKDSNNQQQDTTLTINKIDSLIRLNPLNDSLFYRRSQLHLAKNNLKEAINDLELAIKVDSSKVKYYLDLANLYLLNAQSEKTKKLLEKATKIFPNNYQVFQELGKLYFLVQEYNKAHKYLDRSIELYPYSAKAYYFKAMAFLETGDTAKAKAYLNKAVETNPKFYDGFLMLGAIALNKKDTLAKQYFNTAYMLDTTSIEAKFSLAYYYQTIAKNYPKATEIYEYIITHLDSSYSPAYFNIGYMVLNYTQHPEASINYFLKAYSFDTTNVEALVNTGIAYKELGKKDSAKFYLMKALKIKTNDDRIINLLNSL